MFEIHNMDCIAAMRAMPDNSVDSIVTDPPYELTSARPGGRSPATEGKVRKGFMGMEWDGSGIAYSVEMWREALRVLKPGGHLLSFGGSRTYHRMACAIEDAGFEIRDQIMWVYGSGFPKSLDVSKAIDRARTEDAEPVRVICRAIRAAMDALKIKSRDLAPVFGNCHPRLVDHWAARDTDSQPSLPTWEQWQTLRALLPLPAALDLEVWRLNDRKGKPGDVYQNAEIIGQHETVTPGFTGMRFETVDNFIREQSEVAAQWDGWGTALKPAHEPICVARKPLIGTVAANVLVHGTGALNIDGCRVQSPGEDLTRECRGLASAVHEGYKRPNHETAEKQIFGSTNGRWPANLIHDGSNDVYRGFDLTPEEKAVAICADCGNKYQSNHAGCTWGWKKLNGHALSSAARFFYCAKTSKADRGVDNNHPTVKPTDLMRYLVRLVTPPGGLVLDPFMGSGSTGKACMREGFRFVGCELSAEYVGIATARIEHALWGDLV